MQMYVKQLPNSRKVHVSSRGPGFKLSQRQVKQVQQAIANGKQVMVQGDNRLAIVDVVPNKLCETACKVKIKMLVEKAQQAKVLFNGPTTVYVDYIVALNSIDVTKPFVWPARPAGV